MRALIQRVSYGSVTVEGEKVGEIGQGLVILLGVSKIDSEKNLLHIVDKCLNLRIFSDSEGKMNLSLLDIKAEVLVISQFTLYGETKKGRRPSFTESGHPDMANELYEKFIAEMKKSGLKVEKGIFGADMKVQINNDGPVTFMLEN